MKFLVSVIDSTTRSPHSPEEIAAIDEFNDTIREAGQRIFAGGLDSPAYRATLLQFLCSGRYSQDFPRVF